MGRYDSTEDKKYTLIVIFAVIILIIAGIGWFYFNKPQSPGLGEPEIQTLTLPQQAEEPGVIETLPESQLESTEETAEDATEQSQQQEAFVLPGILSSDALFRESLLAVSPKLAEWLQTDQLIRKYLVIANDFSQGLRIDKHMRFLKPNDPFEVVQGDQNSEELFITAKSYRRYDKLAAAIDALDVPATLAIYKKFRPLFQQVFVEFGYPEQYKLEDIFTKAAAEILASPIIEDPIALIRPSVRYKFANSKLEALNPVKKQMIRMGPENTRIIQNKTRLLVEGLVNFKD